MLETAYSDISHECHGTVVDVEKAGTVSEHDDGEWLEADASFSRLFMPIRLLLKLHRLDRGPLILN